MIIKKLDCSKQILSLTDTKRMKSGLVVLKPGEASGEHITEKREEAIVILEGKAKICEQTDCQIVSANYLVYIPPETKHNVINDSKIDLKYIYLVSMLN